MDSYQEARYIADTIAEEVRNGNHDYSDFAVFYRGHAQSRLLEEALVNKYLPYRIIGARRFYDRKEIADLIAYLRLVVNPDDRLSFRRVINLPKRGIGEKTITRIEEFAEQQGISLIKELEHPDQIPGIGKKIADILSDFFGMITFLGDLNHSGASVREILEQLLNLSAYEEEIKKKNNPDAQTRLDNINELKSLAYEFEQENGLGLDDFLAQIALIQDNDEVDQNSSVTLMTLHGAKGLEFPVVFMTGMEEGIFPSYKTETQEAIEEERRYLVNISLPLREKRGIKIVEHVETHPALQPLSVVVQSAHARIHSLAGPAANTRPASYFLILIDSGIIEIPRKNVKQFCFTFMVWCTASLRYPHERDIRKNQDIRHSAPGLCLTKPPRVVRRRRRSHRSCRPCRRPRRVGRSLSPRSGAALQPSDASPSSLRSPA